MSVKLYTLILFLFPLAGMCQNPDTLVKKLDSLSRKTDSAGYQKNNINPSAYNGRTKITASGYITLLFSDYKQQFTAPFHSTGKDWIKVGAFTLFAGALSLADEPVQQYTVRFTGNNKAVKSISNAVTNAGGLYESFTLAGLGAYGFLFKNEKIKTTTLLASQAYLTSAGVEAVLKLLTGRQRPSYYDPKHVEAEPTFRGPFSRSGTDINGNKINSSFPSGHATVAFAAATVYAMEYRDQPLIPILSYSAAGLIGLSRITENKHWTTDVLVGSALGYLCGRQVVNNYHRYAKVQNLKQKKGHVSLNMHFFDGKMLPGLLYKP